MPNKLRSHNEDKKGGQKGRNNRMVAKQRERERERERERKRERERERERV